MSDPILSDNGRTAASEGVREPAAASHPPAAAPVRRSGGFPVGVSRGLLVAILALAALISLAVWLDARRTQQLLRSEVAVRLGQTEAATQVAAKAQTQLATDLRDAQAKIALLEARVSESQEQQAALEALYRDLAPSRDEIALTETEQVLLVASQQLQLAGNVSSALSALQLADAKLQRLDRPQFLPLRRALARDIDRLRAMPFVDVPGISVKLEQTLAAVDTLPLAMDERVPVPAAQLSAPDADVSSWRRLVRDLWADVRQLIRIEVADRPAAPLVPPPQQYFLRENLKLRLLSARIGLLNRDDTGFKADISAAELWLRQYFDTRARAVQAMQATLKQMAATPMTADVPDLARTLEAMRVLRLAAERAPGRSAVGERPAR